jgi:hypothetical protein
MSFRKRSVTYVKSFLRAFTREKRYPTCFKFRFVSSPLVANRETLPAMLGVLEFVDKGYRVVLEGNAALALCVDNQVVFAPAELIYLRARHAQKMRPG